MIIPDQVIIGIGIFILITYPIGIICIIMMIISFRKFKKKIKNKY
jgi:hypothetical protein